MADYFSQYEDDDKKKKASQVASKTEKAKLSTPDFFTTYEKTAKPVANREPEPIKPEVKKPNPIVQGVKNIVKKITTPTTVQNTNLTPQAGPSPVAKIETVQSTAPSLFDSIKTMPAPIQDDWNLKNDERLQRIKNGTATPMETIGAFLNKSIDVIIGQEYDPQGKKIAPKKVVGSFLEDAMNAMAIGGFGGPQITGIASNAMTGVNTVIDPTIKYGFSLVRGLKTGATFTAIGSLVSSLQERDITVKDSLTSFGLGMILGLHGPVEMKGVATEDLTASKLLLKDYGITAKDFSNPEILKTKWRDNMMKLHPDKGGNAQEFQAFTDAYNKVTSAGVNSKWSMPDINEWFNHLWDKKGMSEKEATAKADKQFKLAIESKAAQNTTGSAPTNVMTPEQALVQIEGSNLKGTPAGTKITEVINKAQTEGKNIQFNVTGSGDVKVVTPGGTNLGMKIVDTQLPVLTTTNPDGTVETINQPVQRQVIKIEKPVGVKTASVTVRGDEAGMTLQIDKEARGQGLGTKMISTMENKAQEAGAKKIVIDASSVANGDAWDNSVGFWEKQGYATVPGAVETNGMIKMEKVLGTTEKPKISNKIVVEEPPAQDKMILPKEVSIADEAKVVGPKRLAPDRITHQQLTPEEGIKSLVLQAENKATRNEDSWKKAIDGLNDLIKTYGNSLPQRSEENLKKFPELQNDFNKYSGLKRYAHNPKNLVDMRDQFIERAKRVAWNPEKQKQYEAKVVDEYKTLIKEDISKGYKYPEEVLNYDPLFKKAVDSRARYEKGLFTSFSADDQRIVFDEQGRIDAGMKRQDGKDLTPEQKQEIIDGVLQTQEALGLDLNKMSVDDRWVYAHLNGKNPFLTKNAAGLYRKGNNQISISVGGTESIKEMVDGKEVSKKINTTVAHELGHALDYKIKNTFIDSSTLFDLRMSFNKVINSTRGDKYWRSSSEVTARSIEEYVAVKEGSDKFFDRQGYWTKDIFDSKIKPAIEKTINDKFAEYKITDKTPKIDRTKLVGRNLSKPNSVLLGEQKPVTPAEVPVVDNKVAIAEANKKLGDYYMKAGEDNPDALGQAWQEVMMQLEVAEPGQRLFTADGEFSGSVSSTFPSFIPEELRSTELFNSVLDGVKDPTNMVYPPNTQPRKQALYDAILGEIDSRAGLDSSGIINEIRSLYEKGKAKPKEVTSGSTTGSQKPEIPAEKVIPPKKEAVPKSDVPTSRLQERIQEQLLEIDQGRYEFDPKSGTYNKLNLEADAQKATYFLQTNPKEALDVAMGYADAPVGQTANAISLAVAFKARAEGNYELWKDIITRTSLRNTKFGQEIVSLRGHFNNDTPENYIKKVLDARMDLLGRNMITDAQKSLGKNKRSAKVNAVEKIDRETDKLVDKVNEPIKSKKVTDRIKMAQDIIDSLICK